MKTLVLFFLALTTGALAQPGLDSVSAYHAAARAAAQERTAGMLQRPQFSAVTFTDNTRHSITLLGIRSEGLVVQHGNGSRIIPREWLGLEDKVRFGYGTPDEVAVVAKIQAEREKARIEAEKLDLLRRQTEAIEAAVGIRPETPREKFQRETGISGGSFRR